MKLNRVIAMCELDVDTARAMSPPNDFSDEMILAGLHKARCEMVDVFDEITAEMADESEKWLSERGVIAGVR